MSERRTDGRIEADLVIAGHTFSARVARAEEGLSEIGGAWVELHVGEELDVEPLLEETAVLSISFDGDEVRRFTMALARGRFLGEKSGSLRYELELRPLFWFLGLQRNIRKFRDMTTEKIVSKVLDESGVPHVWRITRPTAARPYTVQYRETSLDFVKRLLEYEGIYFCFEPDGTLVLADRSQASPPVEGRSEYEVCTAAAALAHGDFEITSFERGARVGSGKATVNDFDWKKPAVPLIASATGAKDTQLEVYDYPTGYRDPGMGQVLAKLRLEALEATKRFAEGTSTVPGFAAGTTFTLAHDEPVAFGGKYLLFSVEHTYVSSPEGVKYENRWSAIPASVPFRPELVTPEPRVAGNHTAMVRGPVGEEIHTDKFGRAKVQFHWDREAKGTDDSRWIRVLQETSTSIALSRVGWEISVGYVDGDPDRPVGLARQINGQMIPSYSQPSNKNRMTIRTETYPGKAGYNEMRMEDSAGSMAIDWHAQKDYKNVVRHDRTETIAQNLTVLIAKGSNRTVEKNQAVAIGANEVRNVGRDSMVKVEQNRTATISGSENIQVGSEMDVTVDGNQTETVGGLRFTRTGSFGVSIPNPKDLLKSLVPSAGDVVGKAAGATFGSQIGDLAGNIASGAKPGDALASLGKSQLSTIAGAAQQGFSQGIAGGLQQGIQQGLQQGLSSAQGIAGGIQQGLQQGISSVQGIAGGLQQGLAGGLPSAESVGAALKGAIPSAQSILSKATGGLSDIRSLSDLTSLLKGSIGRTVQKRFVRTVGGAQIALAGGSISHEAGKLLVEAVGGAKLTVTAKDGIRQAVSGYLSTTVGGAVFRKSKGDMSVSAKKSSVRVGGSATFSSEERFEMRGTEIELVAAQKLTLDAGGLKIEMTPDKTTITGSLKLDAGTKVKVRGNPDKLTG